MNRSSVNMDPQVDIGAAGIAAAIGEPARARMLYCLLDGRARMAGLTAVLLRDRLERLEWLRASGEPPDAYELTEKGSRALDAMGIDVAAMRTPRRRFAFACVDWSERRAHIGGAPGDGLLRHMLGRKWFTRDLNTRALRPTALGRRELQTHFGLAL
jgi:hypothetical protein